MKRMLLLIVGFISVAHADLFVGEVNTPLGIDVKIDGYYKITLEGHLIIDLSSGGVWDATLTTLIDANAVTNPAFHLSSESTNIVSPEESKSDIHHFEIGHHTISGSISTGGPQADRIASTSNSTWKYTVKSAEEIDYRNSIGNLQNSIDQQGTNVASLKNDIATLQAATADQNKGLSDQVANLKNQVDITTQNVASQSAQQTDAVLSAINGVSSQVTTINNNVMSGNKQNQTLEIIGISLGTAGLGAGVGIPLMMEHRNDGNTDVSESLNSDKDSINYVAPGKGD